MPDEGYMPIHNDAKAVRCLAHSGRKGEEHNHNTDQQRVIMMSETLDKSFTTIRIIQNLSMTPLSFLRLRFTATWSSRVSWTVISTPGLLMSPIIALNTLSHATIKGADPCIV